METQVELHNWAMHDEGLVQLRPYKVNSECVCLRMTDKERERVCVWVRVTARVLIGHYLSCCLTYSLTNMASLKPGIFPARAKTNEKP